MSGYGTGDAVNRVGESPLLCVYIPRLLLIATRKWISTPALLAMAVASYASLADGQTIAKSSNDSSAVQSLFISEPFNVQERSELQLTFGSSFMRGTALNANGAVIGFEYGISDRLQTEFEIPFVGQYSAAETTQHVQQLDFGFSYAVRSEPKRFALMPSLHFSHEFGDPQNAPLKIEPGIIVAQRFRATEVHVGFSRSVNTDDSEFSAALVRGRGPWRGTFEVARESEGEQRSWQVAPGFVRKIRNRWCELGVGVPLGVAGYAPRWGISTRVVFEFGGDAR